MTKERIGFIGLGIMGRPMALNLLKAGYELVVWNRTASKMSPLLEAGASAGESPADVARRAAVVISMVSDSPDVEEIALGERGLMAAARPGLLYIDMSTISPRVARNVAARLAEKGTEMLDAPVSGGQRGAVEATLAIMVGGPRAAFDRARPILGALGRTVTHLGPSGQGQAAKLCNQVVCVLNTLAASEALLLAARSGLDPKAFLGAISKGAASSWVLENLGPKMIERDFSPGFMVRLQQKDLRLVLEAARELKVPLPGASLVHKLFGDVEAAGGGELGTQALITALERLAGTGISSGGGREPGGGN
jgi:3-hydroxyisobutyrate dehydrogenase